MSIIVRDDGFHDDTWEAKGGLFVDLEKFGQDLTEKKPERTCVDIPNSVPADSLDGVLANAAMIRIPFPSFADGRGFSLARKLRERGYKGTLRAVGHLISDQYGFARICGFDEVEIGDDLARRQPADQWQARIADPSSTYQTRLMGDHYSASR